MRDLALGRVGIDRGRDRRCARRPRVVSVPRVAGLAAGGGVEHRAVEHDAALLGDGDDARVAVLQIGVVAEQAVGRHRDLTTFTNGGLMSDLALQPVRHRQISSSAGIPD